MMARVLSDIYALRTAYHLHHWIKARSHGAFFFCAFAMQKMDYMGVNEGVHTV